MGLTSKGSFNQRVLQSGVLTTRGPAIRGSYNQGFLQLGVLHPGVLTTIASYKQHIVSKISTDQGS